MYSTLERIKDVIFGLMFVMVLVACVVMYGQHLKIKSLESKSDNSAAQVAGYKEYTAKHQAVTKQKEASDARIEDVFTKHVEFVDMPVPDDVADILREHPVPR